MQLDEVEPFDEWEEFALFGCHYTLLEASNVHLPTHPLHNTTATIVDSPGKLDSEPSQLKGKMEYTEFAKSNGIRRFGAPLSVKGANGCSDLKANFGGMGVNNRLGSIDIFTSASQGGSSSPGPTLRTKPESRMCHTLTDLGDCGSLLVGGRSSPDRAFADCWLYSKLSHTWERVDDIPVARYRHSAFALGDGSVLVTGGKEDSKTVLNDTFIWNRQTGWKECSLDHDLALESGKPQVFGALMISDVTSKTSTTSGFLIGGMSTDGLVSTDLWSWELHPEHLTIRWTCHGKAAGAENPYLNRFGACLANHGGKSLVVGGIMPGNLIPEHGEVVALHIESEGRLKTNLIDMERCETRPLLVGHSISTSGNSSLIMGGGAVCFSFGTYWNRGCYTLSLDGEDGSNLAGLDKQITGSTESWTFLDTVDSESSQPPKVSSRSSPLEYEKPKEPITVARKKISSWTDFAAILSSAQPVILEGLDIGSCTELWTNSYLLDRIGQDRNASNLLSLDSSFLTYAGNRPPSERGSHGFCIKKLPIRHQRL
jgi:tRNA wybutosine-synthesizing protein 4